MSYTTFKIRFLLTLSVLVLVQSLFSQETKKVKLLNANKLIGVNQGIKQYQILRGNVELQHENTFFYCDSANLMRQTNSFRAFQNVHIIINDTVNIYGDSLDYDGNTKIAELYGDVKLVDKKATLYTDYLIFDRNTNIASYITWGRILDAENELLSDIGYYYSNIDEFFFKQDVVVTTPDYRMYSDTLRYNTETEIVFFLGPTNIIGEEDSLYCEWGWYDTQQDIGNLKKNVFANHLEQFMWADTIYYSKPDGFGEAISNIKIVDTIQDMVVYGQLGQYYKEKHLAYVTDSAIAVFIDAKNQDSLFLHGDTLRVNMDENNKAREMMAYNHVKLFGKELQGACDSLIYKTADSTIMMYGNPVLWSDANQLTADSILMAMKNNQIDTIVFYTSCFIISKDDSGAFNQIKGKNMIGYFKNNEMKKMVVKGNSETIYFVREEEGGLIGVNKAVASDLLILLENRELKSITYMVAPKATLFPEGELFPQDLIIRGFKWLEHQRPIDKSEIFIWKENPDAEGLED
jgi:lipopolysaccharide export system protein LptA